MATVAIKTNPVNWFEIPVKDLARAQNFYEKVLDRKLTREDMDTLNMAFPAMEQGVPGAAGALIKGDPMGRHMHERSCISPLMISKKHCVE
jgi:predicted enzyme related to lactoylglutathione lyase